MRKGVGSMAENDGAQMHSILLEEREKLRVTGVSDVQSFDEEQVLLETGKGTLLEYDDSGPPRGGVLRRLFGA